MAIPYPGSKDFSGTGGVLGRLVVLLANGEVLLAVEASAIVEVRQGQVWDGVRRTTLAYRRGGEVASVDILTPMAEVVRLWAEALGSTAGGG
jgi:hypothetical protein